MPSRTFGASRTANTIVDNVLSGTGLEFPATNILLSVGAVVSATGLEFTLIIEQETILDRYVPVVRTTAPLFPDDYMVRELFVPAGAYIILRLNNTTGGAITDISAVRQDPV